MSLKRALRHERKAMTVLPVEHPEPLRPETDALVDSATEGMEMGRDAEDVNPIPADLAPTELDRNENPLRPSIQPMPSRRRLVRLWRRFQGWLRARFGPQRLSEAERIERNELLARKQLEQQLRAEAELYMDRIINALNARELCYRYKEHEKSMLTGGVQSVRFDLIGLQPDAIYLRIDTNRRPRGVGILDLLNDDILTDLSVTVGHKVTGHYSERLGAMYIIERASGVMGIPAHVKFQDMLDTWPPSSDELTIPLGMTQNSKRVYRSLKSFPHLLIGGATDQGKSNMMNVILGTFLLNNTPEQLRMILVDLKGGMEFTFYEGLPHLYRPLMLGERVISETGIIYDRDQVPDALQVLVVEGERRMAIMREKGHKNIASYNAHRRPDHRLPRILLVVDEWADVRLVQGLGTKAEKALSNIASRMRAVGIHLIVATQNPKKEVISTIVKTNLPAKMAFSVPDNTSSQIIIDTADARGLAPRGRYAFVGGSTRMIIQAPYMPDTVIREIVANSISGRLERPKTRHDVTIEEVLEWALDNEQGKLALRVLYAQYKDRGVGRDEMSDWLSKLDGKTIQVRDNYYVIKPVGSAKVRTLVVADPSEYEASQPKITVQPPAGSSPDAGTRT